MRVLLLGRNGQLGHELQRALAPLGEVTALSRAELDLADAGALRSALRAREYQVVVNAAAYTAVDKAESEPELALRANGEAPGVLAEGCTALGALLVHYSTDYVFDGAADQPYDEDAAPAPRSAYGRSKLAGERAIRDSDCAHLILRTGWVYSGRGRNFLLTMLKLARDKGELRVVSDQVGSPTWSRSLAEASVQLLQRVLGAPRPGRLTLHMSCAGRTTWHGFATRIVERGAALGLCREVPVRAISTVEFPTPALRPAFSVLSNERLAREFGIRLPSWEEALDRCLAGMARPPAGFRLAPE